MTDREKLARINGISEGYRRRRASGLVVGLYILAVCITFFSLPGIIARGVGGTSTGTFLLGLAFWAVLVGISRRNKKRLERAQADFYEGVSEILGETFREYAPAVSAEPGRDFFKAPMDYGFFTNGKQPEYMRAGGILDGRYADAEAEGYYYVRAYRYEVEKERSGENEKRSTETCYRAAQGLAWNIRPDVPVLREGYIRITRQRKTFGSEFLSGLFPGTGKRNVSTGDPEFDGRFRVQSDAAAVAEAYLTPGRMRKLIGLRDAVGDFGVYITAEGITVSFTEFRVMDTGDMRGSGMGILREDMLKDARRQLEDIVTSLPSLWREV